MRLETLVRSRPLRLALAAAMVVTALWGFAPYALGDVSARAYVTAPLWQVATPIAGLAQPLPAVGTRLDSPRRLALVTARSLDTAALGALDTERAARAGELALATRQIAELTAMDRRLAARARAYGGAAGARLDAALAAARAERTACTSDAEAATRQQARLEALAPRQFVTTAAVERARAAAAATMARCASLDARLASLAQERAVVGAGLYFGEGVGDASYAEQQRDRLVLRRQELETIATRAAAELGTLDRRIAAERARLGSQRAYATTLPAGQLVWRVAAAPGQAVAAGTALLELADCRRRSVIVSLPERRGGAVRPGDPASVRLIGTGDWQPARVLAVLGAQARREAASVAAIDPAPEAGALTVEVGLADAGGARCDIGRLAEVRLGAPALDVTGLGRARLASLLPLP